MKPAILPTPQILLRYVCNPTQFAFSVEFHKEVEYDLHFSAVFGFVFHYTTVLHSSRHFLSMYDIELPMLLSNMIHGGFQFLFHHPAST